MLQQLFMKNVYNSMETWKGLSHYAPSWAVRRIYALVALQKESCFHVILILPSLMWTFDIFTYYPSPPPHQISCLMLYIFSFLHTFKVWLSLQPYCEIHLVDKLWYFFVCISNSHVHILYWLIISTIITFSRVPDYKSHRIGGGTSQHAVKTF